MADLDPILRRVVGRSIVAARFTPGSPAHELFQSFAPAAGTPFGPMLTAASEHDIRSATSAAAAAFARPRDASWRAGWLDALAARLDSDRSALLRIANRETGITRCHLAREFARMTGTLRLFAEIIRSSNWHRASITERSTSSIGPGHALQQHLIPRGVVAVFGASNFPFAYGVAGGDTASAIAAGCPVIVKGHPLHSLTGELIAQHLAAALPTGGDGWFSYLHAGGSAATSIGLALVRHPDVAASGFTGSFAAGTALAAAAADRSHLVGVHEPGLVFSEMGSCNPVLVLPGAAAERGDAIADELARSILYNSGQQCTKPGLIYIDAAHADRFAARLASRLSQRRPRALLSPSITSAYYRRIEEMITAHGAEALLPIPPAGSPARRFGQPMVLRLTADQMLEVESRSRESQEIFGPATIVVRSGGESDGPPLAGCVGSLAGSIYFADSDHPHLPESLASLSRICGRVIFNAPTTGVRVCESMTHGGPWPATNRPDSTAVGPRAIERWCRWVSWQGVPQEVEQWFGAVEQWSRGAVGQGEVGAKTNAEGAARGAG